MEVVGPRQNQTRIPASQAAAEWARQRREALDRAAVLREQRRAANEAQQARWNIYLSEMWLAGL